MKNAALVAVQGDAVPLGAICYASIAEDVVSGGWFEACAATPTSVATAGYLEGRVDVGTGVETPPGDFNILVAMYDRETPP